MNAGLHMWVRMYTEGGRNSGRLVDYERSGLVCAQQLTAAATVPPSPVLSPSGGQKPPADRG